MFFNNAEKKNDKRIASINSMITDLFVLDKSTDNSKISDEIMGQILLLNAEYQKRNDSVLQPLHLYFNVLSSRVRYYIDTTVHDDELDSYTIFFLDNKQKLLKIFSKKSLQKVCMFLIAANANIHNLDRYEQLLESYIDIFSYKYKINLFNRLLELPCLRLDLERFILPLFRKLDVKYNKRTKEERCSLLADLIQIAYKLDLSSCSDELNSYIEKHHSLLKGECDETIINFYDTLLKCGRKQICQEWISSIDKDDLAGSLRIKYEKIISKINGCSLKAEADGTVLKNDFTDKYVQFIKKSNDIRQSKKQLYDEARDAIQYYIAKSRELQSDDQKYTCNIYYYTLMQYARSLRFWALFEEALQGHENADKCERIVFFINDWSLVNASICLPVLMAAERMGFTFVPSSGRMCQVSHYKDPFLDDIAGKFMNDHDSRFEQDDSLDCECLIDVPNKKIIVDGINIYQPLYEFIARYQFTYFFSYDTDAWVRYQVHKMVRRFSRLFEYIKQIEKWAVDSNKKVYFVSHAPHLQNAAAFRLYCEVNKTKQLNYICVSAGYDNYFKNIGDAKTETVSALNLTKNNDSRNSFLGTKEGFEEYYKKNLCHIDDIQDKAEKYFAMHRGVKKLSDSLGEEKQTIINRIKQSKEENKTIILLNGKVIFDLAVKYTRGCVHNDMSEWITHAVEYTKRHSDVLLLIKPHPHEVREDLTLSPNLNHTLKSIIMCELGDNTIYLNSQLFTNAELLPYVDLGLIWNGTSALEFTAQGIPTLIGDEWGYLDYPIGFTHPNTIDEYEHYIKEPHCLINDELRNRAVMFLSYMGSNDVRISNPYTKTTSLNFNQFESSIDLEKVKEFFANGNIELENMFEAVL